MQHSLALFAQQEITTSQIYELVSLGMDFSQSLKEVARMEAALSAEFHNLSSPYRTLSCAFLNDAVNDISVAVKEGSPLEIQRRNCIGSGVKMG